VVLIDLQQMVSAQCTSNVSGTLKNGETATSRLKRRAQK
jgi:hypothetical protein